MAGSKWQRPGWQGADGDRDKNKQQGVDATPPPPRPAVDPRTGWHYMTGEGRVAGPFKSAKEAKEDAFRHRETTYTVCAPKPPEEGPAGPEQGTQAPVGANGPAGPAVVRTVIKPAPEEEDDGPPPTTGWHYYDEESPEEGSVGPFDSPAEAAAHADEAYPDGGYVLCPPRKEASDGT